VLCGLLLGMPLIAAAQSEPDESSTPVAALSELDATPEPEAAATSVADANLPTTRVIDASEVESPFAGVSVADVGTVATEAEPPATPAPRQQLPPGPPSRFP
jgi:hypothetical protein